MNRWNKLIAEKEFDMLLFEEFIKEKGIGKVTQAELDRVVKVFNQQPFEYLKFCDVYDEVIMRRTNALAINFSVIVTLFVITVTYGLMQLYIGKLRVLFTML